MKQGVRRGIPVIISGPSGSGKGTVVADILTRNHQYALSVSATTRAPRPGEINGKHYYFISREEFAHRIETGDMLEHACYVGNEYGTPRSEVEQRLRDGIHVILEIDVQGAVQIKEKFPEALLIFLMPPDEKTLERRLRGRGTNTEADIARRLEQARRELEYFDRYDYLVINREGSVQSSADTIMRIVESEQCSVRRNTDFAKHYFS